MNRVIFPFSFPLSLFFLPLPLLEEQRGREEARDQKKRGEDDRVGGVIGTRARENLHRRT